jgi:hypothetical protein
LKLYVQRTSGASMRNVESVSQNLDARRGALGWWAPSWAAVLMITVGALGCGRSFWGTGPLDDTPEPDAAPPGRGAQDASLSPPDGARDASLEDDLSNTEDTPTREDAEHDGAPDGTGNTDTGDSSVSDDADGSLVPDAHDVETDVAADEGAGDAPSDVPSGDIGADADGRIVCGFAPPAPGGTCPPICNDGCVGGMCQIACRDEQECEKATIACPVGFTCDVNCAGKQSCDGVTLVCPDTYACRLLCAGEQSCKSVEVNCGGGPCQVTCLASKQACESTVVHCGAQSCTASCMSMEGEPTLNCGQSCDCRPCP